MSRKSRTKKSEKPIWKRKNGITYRSDSFGKWGVVSTDKNIVFADVESSIDNSPVEFFDVCSFSDCKNLETIRIPDNIRFIGLCAFDGCENIKRVLFSQSLVDRSDADTIFERLWIADLKTREVLLRIPSV